MVLQAEIRRDRNVFHENKVTAILNAGDSTTISDIVLTRGLQGSSVVVSGIYLATHVEGGQHHRVQDQSSGLCDGGQQNIVLAFA